MTNVYLVSEEVLLRVLSEFPTCGCKSYEDVGELLCKGPLEPVAEKKVTAPGLINWFDIPNEGTKLYALKD
jgi:hypothetical protein